MPIVLKLIFLTQAAGGAEASDPLGATASTSLIVHDGSGSLAVTAVTGAGGEVAGRVDTAGEAEAVQSSRSLSSKEPPVQDLSLLLPPLPAVAVRPSAASLGGGSSGAGSSAGSTAGEPASVAKPDTGNPLLESAAKQEAQPGSSAEAQAAGPSSGREGAGGSVRLAADLAGSVSDESLDGQELLPAPGLHAKGAPAADDEVLGSSPDSSSRGGCDRSASLGGGAWSPQADREGSPGGNRGAGQWRELGGSVRKKYYDKYYNQVALLHLLAAPTFAC